ncbi:MAG: hypothetical protein WKG07_01315 [Hymenobacter sp.]
MEDDILLFAARPERTVIAEAGVTARTCRRTAARWAISAATPPGWDCGWQEASDASKPARRAEVSRRRSPPPASLVFSDSGSAMAVSSPTETLVISASGSSSSQAVPLGGVVRFAPDQLERFAAPLAGRPTGR